FRWWRKIFGVRRLDGAFSFRSRAPDKLQSGVKPPNSKVNSCANLMAMSERSGNRDLVREFLSYIQVEKGLSANTLQSYARDIAKLQSWAVNANKQVERLERKDVREWIASMSREGLAPSSVSRS